MYLVTAFGKYASFPFCNTDVFENIDTAKSGLTNYMKNTCIIILMQVIQHAYVAVIITYRTGSPM